MEFHLYKPDLRLEPYVSRIWVMKSDTALPGLVHPVVPNGRVKIMFNFADDFTLEYEDRSTTLLREPTFVGQMNRPALVTSTGRIGVIGVEFHTCAARALFPWPQKETARRVPYLAEIPRFDWQSEVQHRLREADSDHTRVNLLQNALLRYVRRYEVQVLPKDQLMAYLTDRLKKGGNLAGLAKDTGMSFRTLERLVESHTGLSPKKLQRIFRLQNTFSLVQSCPGHSWAFYAAEAGYADQAHMIHDFRALTGDTPVQFVRKMTTLSENFAHTREI